MIRLFLSLIAFLSVSLSGLWYGSSTDAPLDQTAFENTSLILENKPLEVPASELVWPETPDVVSGVESGAPIEIEKQLPEVSVMQPAETPPTQLSDKSALAVESRPLRFGYRVPSGSRSIDTIVLHSSYNASDGDQYDLEKTISQYETYGVGAHYIIDRKGVVYRLVEEDNIAYHAGASKMPDGRKNVNDFSIGIEMIATEESGYTDKQYAAVNALIADIKSRHKIKSVVGHADIAPGRKTDPWKFDWKKLR
jgi:hypothetical protein